MTREKFCFVFAIFDAVNIVSLCHFNSWMEAWRCGFEFLKSKPLARIGQQNRPLNMALKALLMTCVWIPSSVSVAILMTLLKGTSVLESGHRGTDGRTLHWGVKGCLFRTHRWQSHCVNVSLSKHIICILILVRPRKTENHPNTTEKLLTAT